MRRVSIRDSPVRPRCVQENRGKVSTCATLVLQMGRSIDGYISGGPEEDIGGGGPQHPEVADRIMDWITRAGAHAMGRQDL